MKLVSRLGTIIFALVFLAYGWITVLSTESNQELQDNLYHEALILMENDIFVRAQPLLEEALTYDGALTKECQLALQKVYLQLEHLGGYSGKFVALSETILSQETATVQDFLDFSQYYFNKNKISLGISVLRNGVERTGDLELETRYEEKRYAYQVSRYSYDEVSEFFNSTIQVMHQGKWGIARSNGALFLDCDYDKISTYSNGIAIVETEGQVYAVDGNGSKMYITTEEVLDFTNLSDNRFTFTTNTGLFRANSSLESVETSLDFIGTYWNSYAPAEMSGKWGVIDTEAEWAIPAVYDGIIMDELGRAVGQSNVFVEKDGTILQLKGSDTFSTIFEDAKPFSNENYAAVKQGGKWGFVDSEGVLVIPFQFEDAKSFGQHLAAVKIDGLWGYISLSGTVVIEPQFQDAKSFSYGSAPVKQDDVWVFITLLEE